MARQGRPERNRTARSFRQLRRFHRLINSDKVFGTRSGVNETARRLKQLVGQIFRFAIVTGRAKRDPSADLKDALRATGEPQRHRAMPLLELPTFLQKLEIYSGEHQTKLALKLVTLTFLRTTELRAGKWSELALQLLFLRASESMGNHD